VKDTVATALDQALELSQEMLEVAEAGDAAGIASLDAQRRALLKSVKEARRALDQRELAVLRTIADLNALSLGKMEHRLRAKCRDLDMLAAGRRAVRAYGKAAF
jgi:hypothetical protein